VTSTPARLEAWLTGAKERVRSKTLAPVTEVLGRVESVADGIALLSGLPHVGLDELLRFEHGEFGFAITLDRDVIGCVLLDGAAGIEAGHRVGGTARSCKFRWAQSCSEGSLTHWAGPLMAPDPWNAKITSPSSVPPPPSSIAIL
jgi:F-type H+/Na+-transporting ATPase subunit alpha